MKLAEALDIDGERIVALAGGGGKTSSLFLLGQELAEQGRRVVLATTAKMYKPLPGQIPIILESRPGLIGERVAQALRKHNQVLVAAGVENDKLTGLSCPLLMELSALDKADKIIVEADGSRGLPLKFAAQYEPVVCTPQAMVTPVLGINALGARLDECSFQRWDLACKYLGVEYGTKITPDLAVKAICHPQSYGRFIGINRVVPLINQVENHEQEDLAWETARIFMAQAGIDRVVIGAVQTDKPVRAVIFRYKGERDNA